MPSVQSLISKRILILGSVISLPLIYGIKANIFGEQLDKHLFAAVYPTDKNELKISTSQSTLLRKIALMQLYACGVARKVNHEFDPLDSVLDCSDFFKNPESLKVEFKAIWEQGGKRSQADRLLADRSGKNLTEGSVDKLLAELKKQSTPQYQSMVQKLLTSEVRPYFDHTQKTAVGPLGDDVQTVVGILQMYEV